MSNSKCNLRGRRVLALCVLTAASISPTAVTTSPADAAAPARAGRACETRQTGLTTTRAPLLVCLGVTSCAGRRKMLWLPLARNETYPNDATLSRYGQCPRSPGTTSPASVASGAGSGVACLMGDWTFSGSDMRQFLVDASGSPDAALNFSGSISYRLSGGAREGGVVNDADATGSGSMTGGAPGDVVRGKVVPIVGAKFKANENQIFFRATDALFTYEITVNGQAMPIQQFEPGTGSNARTYECNGATLRVVVDIPAAGGQPARTAVIVMRRG